MKELASLENKVKFVTLIGGFMSLYFAIKSDIRELYTEKHYEVEHLQYQINEIKNDCCNQKSKQTTINRTNYEAVLPTETKLEYHF